MGHSFAASAELACSTRRAVAVAVTVGTLGTSVSASEALDIAAGLPKHFECAGYSLSEPRPIGSGGHGTVYADTKASVVAKVSYPNTAETVTGECATLRRLEAFHVPFAERCLGTCVVGDRVVALFSPYFKGGRQVSREVIESLTGEALAKFIRASTLFLVRCLVAGVAVSDLQVLARPNGEILVIDFNLAGLVDDDLGLSRTLQFLGEWTTVLPPSLHGAVADAFTLELDRLSPGALPSNAASAIIDMTLNSAPETSLTLMAEAAQRATR